VNSLAHLVIEEVRLQPGQEWVGATPQVWRFACVQAGAAYWLGLPKTRAIAEGEMLILPPEVRGIIRASQLNEVSLLTFTFAPELLTGLFNLTERHFFEHGAADDAEVQFLPSTHPATKRLILLASLGPGRGSLSRRVEGLGVVAAVFDDELARHHPPETLGASASSRFEELITQMPDTEFINRPPTELARLCSCSARHFNRLFREHFGVSVRARQTELRLLKARKLLGTTQGKITEVAFESGYRNLSLFNSLFKRRFGVTPTEWRQQCGIDRGHAGPNGPIAG